MKKTIIQFKAMMPVDMQINTETWGFKVSFLQDGAPQSFVERFTVVDPLKRAEELIKKMKSYAKVEVTEADDLIGSLIVTEFLDEEKIEEVLTNFFLRLSERMRILKRTTNHTEYMKLYDQVRTEKLVL